MHIICCLDIILKTYCYQNVEIYACRFHLERNRNIDYFDVQNLFSLLTDKKVQIQAIGKMKNELIFGQKKKL